MPCWLSSSELFVEILTGCQPSLVFSKTFYLKQNREEIVFLLFNDERQLNWSRSELEWPVLQFLCGFILFTKSCVLFLFFIWRISIFYHKVEAIHKKTREVKRTRKQLLAGTDAKHRKMHFKNCLLKKTLFVRENLTDCWPYSLSIPCNHKIFKVVFISTMSVCFMPGCALKTGRQ